MDADHLQAWLLEEKANADAALSSLGIDAYQTVVGPWVRNDDGGWNQPELDRYQGASMDLTSKEKLSSRLAVEEFLAGQAVKYPIRFGVYPTNAELHAELWATSALRDFFRRITSDSEVEVIAGTVAEKLFGDAHRDHQIIVERVLLGSPEIGEILEIGGYVVRPPDGSDIRMIHGANPWWEPTVSTTSLGVLPTAVLEVTYKVPLDDDGASRHLASLMIGLMLADAPFAAMTGVIRYADSYRSSHFTFSMPEGVNWNGSRALDTEVLEEAISLSQKYDSTDPGIARACRRLLRSTREFVDPSDRIVDVVIAMESLLTESKREQVGYQFRTIGAMLLSDSYAERVEIRGDLGDAYNERSAIVHSNSITKWDRDRINKLAWMARRLCYLFVDEGRPDFDELLLKP